MGHGFVHVLFLLALPNPFLFFWLVSPPLQRRTMVGAFPPPSYQSYTHFCTCCCCICCWSCCCCFCCLCCCCCCSCCCSFSSNSSFWRYGSGWCCFSCWRGRTCHFLTLPRHHLPNTVRDLAKHFPCLAWLPCPVLAGTCFDMCFEAPHHQQ